MSGKSIAILQSNYLPWKGTFDLMAAVDEFVILDSVQFTKNDWRNRNRIRSASGTQWLTIPIRTAGRWGQRITEAEIAEPQWARRHWRSVAQNYARAPRFRRYAEELEAAYGRAGGERSLSSVNRTFLDLLRGWLNIGTQLTSAEEYPDHADRVERLIGICHAAGAKRYVSGAAAKAYLDPSRFRAAGIDVAFFEYACADEPHLSALDGVLRG